ncbi:MAG: hypothetical protein IPJ81_14520 [Chitinophagaceae bacterium]|nr:hypothetical protein [Chitinophagaceae bacterium]
MKKSEESYEDGSEVGKWSGWYESGKKKFEGQYYDDIPDVKDGTWTYWYENGKQLKETIYDQGALQKQTNWYKNGNKKEEKIYTYAKSMQNIQVTTWDKNGKKLSFFQKQLPIGSEEN